MNTRFLLVAGVMLGLLAGLDRFSSMSKIHDFCPELSSGPTKPSDVDRFVREISVFIERHQRLNTHPSWICSMLSESNFMRRLYSVVQLILNVKKSGVTTKWESPRQCMSIERLSE